MPDRKTTRIDKLAEEMERQLQRPLTPEERRCLALYLDATPDDEVTDGPRPGADRGHFAG